MTAPTARAKAFLKRHPRLRAAARGLVSAASRPFGTITHAATREPLVALTFDDGPDPTTTPRFLELLEAHGARGTFFMVGKAAARHRDLVERVAGGGHAIGNHTWDHPSMPLLTRRGRRAQIRWCAEALAPWGERLFRPPYGHHTFASQLDVAALGYRVVIGSIVAEDWRDDPAEVIAARVRARLEAGAIVLFHDALYTTVDRRFDDRGPALAAIETLLVEHAGRYRFVTVPELLASGSPRTSPWYKRPDLDWLHRLV